MLAIKGISLLFLGDDVIGEFPRGLEGIKGRPGARCHPKNLGRPKATYTTHIIQDLHSAVNLEP